MALQGKNAEDAGACVKKVAHPDLAYFFDIRGVDMLTYPRAFTKRLWKEIQHVHEFVIPWFWHSGLQVFEDGI